MEMYVGDRCRFFDARMEAWVRGEITDITISPLTSACVAPFITVSTTHGDFVVLGTEYNLDRCEFRITFSNFLRAAG